MVRYDKNHKEQMRTAILEAASEAFRAHGIDGVGVGEVMADVGLTHGGFYAHFESKDDLAAQACARALAEAAIRRFAPPDGDTPQLTLPSYIRSYLSRSHRDTPETGCAVAALASDVARRSPTTRHAFTEAAGTYVDGIASLLPDDTDQDAAWALLAGMAGAVMLARAVDDPVLSDRILRASRELYTAALCEGTESIA